MLQSSESIAGAALSPSGVEPGLAAVLLSWEASWAIGACFLLVGFLYVLHVRRQLRMKERAAIRASVGKRH